MQNTVLSNQLKRQDEEIKNLTAKIETGERTEKELHTKIREQDRKYTDLEAKVRP